MSETWFSDNYHDMSVQRGVNAGFQFEFYCQRCRVAYRTPFDPYRSAQASGWLGKAAGMFGGVLGNAENVAEGLLDAGWAKARDGAFREAIEQAQQYFHRCPRCLYYVCDACFNKDAGLCLNCAPDAEVEIESARATGRMQAASVKANEYGQELGAQMDVKRDRQLVCPNCNAETHGAKFCPECGTKMAVLSNCPSCNVEVSPGAKFCPECGTKIG